MPLTDAQIKYLKADGNRIRRSDGGGLFLDVMPSGKKTFRLAYRANGKQRTIWIGDYPDLRLADARLKTAELKQDLRNGIDPKEKASNKQPDSPVETRPLWKDIARDYVKLRKRSGAAPRTITKLVRQVEVTITSLGDRAIEDISAENVLSVVNPIAERAMSKMHTKSGRGSLRFLDTQRRVDWQRPTLRR